MDEVNGLNENDVELKLLGNRPIHIDGVGEINFPNITEIMDIGETYYNQIIGSLLFKKDNLEKNDNEEYEKLSEFELFYIYCCQVDKFRETIFNGLRLLFNDVPKIDEDILGIYFGEIKDRRIIDGSNFEIIQKLIAKANWIKIEKKNEKEFNPVDERAQAIVDMIMKKRKNAPKIKEKINLHSIIAGLTWKANGISLKEINAMTIYQLYMGYFVSQNIDSHYFTLTGIYTGNIDAKNIDMSDISWARKLESQ